MNKRQKQKLNKNKNKTKMKEEKMMAYTAAVLTISDKGSTGERIDTSGPMLVKKLQDKGFDVVYTSIIPDERDMIKRELIKCSDDQKINLVLTTGGTGFAARDITPEATMDVIDRETPGIPELMRQESAKITNKACLSRSKAGIRKQTLIINLPGSEKAARENFEAVEGALDHGMEMLLSLGSANCGEPVKGQVFGMKTSQDEQAGVVYNDEPQIAPPAYMTGVSPQLAVQTKAEAVSGVSAQLSAQTKTEAVSGVSPQLTAQAKSEAVFAEHAKADDEILSIEIAEPVEETPKKEGAQADEWSMQGTQEIKEEAFEPVVRKLPPKDSLFKGQIYNGKKLPPRVDLWLKEAKESDNAARCGMYLVHNGTVREDAKAMVRLGAENTENVTGMNFGYDEALVRAAIEDAYNMPGIYYIKVWLNEGELELGDDIMFVLVGGDIRPHVIDALQTLVGTIKNTCVREIELY